MCFFQTCDYNKSLLLCDHSPPLLIIEFLKHLNKGKQRKGKIIPLLIVLISSLILYSSLLANFQTHCSGFGSSEG